MPQDDIEIKEVEFSNIVLLPEIVKMMNEGHTVTLRLRGFSMRPFLEDNRDKALLAKANRVHVGDAVLAEINPKHYVLHRIIKIEGDNITLRGDGNLAVEHCKTNDVKGFALGFYRKGHKYLDKTDGIKWHIYSFVWMALYPIRRYILAAYRHIWLKIFKPI